MVKVNVSTRHVDFNYPKYVSDTQKDRNKAKKENTVSLSSSTFHSPGPFYMRKIHNLRKFDYLYI